MFSFGTLKQKNFDKYIEHANRHHATIKFKAEISDKETIFLDTSVIFLMCPLTSNIHFSSYHPPGASKGFIKGEAPRLLRTNSSISTFEENNCNFRVRLHMRGYPSHLLDVILSEVKFTKGKSETKDATVLRHTISPIMA